MPRRGAGAAQVTELPGYRLGPTPAQHMPHMLHSDLIAVKELLTSQ